MRGKRSFFSLSTLITKLKCKIKKKKDEMSRITLKYNFKNKVKMLKSLSWRFTTIDELAVNLQNGPQKQRNSSSLEAIRCIVLYRKILQDIPDPDPPKMNHMFLFTDKQVNKHQGVSVCVVLYSPASLCVDPHWYSLYHVGQATTLSLLLLITVSAWFQMCVCVICFSVI